MVPQDDFMVNYKVIFKDVLTFRCAVYVIVCIFGEVVSKEEYSHLELNLTFPVIASAFLLSIVYSF